MGMRWYVRRGDSPTIAAFQRFVQAWNTSAVPHTCTEDLSTSMRESSEAEGLRQQARRRHSPGMGPVASTTRDDVRSGSRLHYRPRHCAEVRMRYPRPRRGPAPVLDNPYADPLLLLWRAAAMNNGFIVREKWSRHD